MSTSSPLCQLNGGCMGCCGHDFVSPDSIKEAIRKNTLEFNQADPKVPAQFKRFRDRAKPYDLRSGVCRNLIEKDGCVHCPLHPALHDGKDLRENHCDTNYLCRTAREFSHWNDKKQQQFLHFIAGKNLDNITYSLKMDRGELLREFTTMFLKEEKSLPPIGPIV